MSSPGFVKHAAAQGIDIFRIFDSLNYLPNLKVAMEAVQETHAICEAAICYTGDILDPKRTKYSLKYYVKLDALTRPAVDLADVEGALSAEEDPPGTDVVRPEVGEGAHRALSADGLGDGRFVDAVLERDDEPLVGEPWSDRRDSLLRTAFSTASRQTVRLWGRSCATPPALAP